MAAAKDKTILWEVGCEGHKDAWVIAPTWELATVEAAKFWEVPWREVAAYCEMKRKIVALARNICKRCGRYIFSGEPPLCDGCLKEAKLEEAELQRCRRRAYQRGVLV